MAANSMSKRSIALITAVVLAAAAALALYSYTNGIEDRAYAGVRTVSVFLAKDTIPAGTSAEAASAKGLIERSKIPAKAVAEGAVTSLNQIAGKQSTVTILKGEQIVNGRFAVGGQAKGILPIPADRQAITVSVGIPPGVGGFVQPGDQVSVIAQLKQPGASTDGGDQKVQFLLQAVPVLAVGQQVVDAPAPKEGEEAAAEAQTSAVMLTLALPAADAEKLAYAVMQGQLYFTLLPPGQAPAQTPGRTIQNAFA